jgi:hypothetical protein
MIKSYSILASASSGLSSAVLIPIVMLIGVVMGIAGAVVGIARREARNGVSRNSKRSIASRDYDRSTASSAADVAR